MEINYSHRLPAVSSQKLIGNKAKRPTGFAETDGLPIHKLFQDTLIEFFKI